MLTAKEDGTWTGLNCREYGSATIRIGAITRIVHYHSWIPARWLTTWPPKVPVVTVCDGAKMAKQSQKRAPVNLEYAGVTLKATTPGAVEAYLASVTCLLSGWLLHYELEIGVNFASTRYPLIHSILFMSLGVWIGIRWYVAVLVLAMTALIVRFIFLYHRQVTLPRLILLCVGVAFGSAVFFAYGARLIRQFS